MLISSSNKIDLLPLIEKESPKNSQTSWLTKSQKVALAVGGIAATLGITSYFIATRMLNSSESLETNSTANPMLDMSSSLVANHSQASIENCFLNGVDWAVEQLRANCSGLWDCLANWSRNDTGCYVQNICNDTLNITSEIPDLEEHLLVSNETSLVSIHGNCTRLRLTI